MKKKIYFVLTSALFLFLFVHSSSKANLSEKNLDFVKNAKASMTCEWTMDTRVCCFSEPTGGCLAFDWYRWDGPYYYHLP